MLLLKLVFTILNLRNIQYNFLDKEVLIEQIGNGSYDLIFSMNNV